MNGRKEYNGIALNRLLSPLLFSLLLTLKAVWSKASSKKKVVTGNARPGIVIRAQPVEMT